MLYTPEQYCNYYRDWNKISQDFPTILLYWRIFFATVGFRDTWPSVSGLIISTLEAHVLYPQSTTYIPQANSEAISHLFPHELSMVNKPLPLNKIFLLFRYEKYQSSAK